MHRASRDLIRATDSTAGLLLTQWFCEAYNVLLQHHLVTRDRNTIARLISRHYADKPEHAAALRWLYSENDLPELPLRMTKRLA